MKILITGHSGLLGSTLADRLLTDGHIVHGISRSNRNTINGVVDYNFDLQDKQITLNNIGKIAPDVVYHLAANASEAMGQKSPIDMTQRNIGIFTNVLEASLQSGVKKFIYSSSIAVYGKAPSPYEESSYPIPKDVYGINKLACEQMLKVMAQVYELDYVILRPHNLYGERQNMADPTRNVVAMFMRRIMEGLPCVLYGEGRMVRQFSYIEDVVDIFQHALDESVSKMTINVGSPTETRIADLFQMLQEITGIQVEVSHAPARPQEISGFTAKHDIQDKLFQYKNTSLLTGLVKTWYAIKNATLPPLEVHKNEIENTLR